MAPHRSRRAPRATLALVAALVAAYVAHVRVLDYVSDDGYIALRYVRNFLAGHGFVYNPGERVEGYSSFTWVAGLGLLAKLVPGIALARLAEIAGIACGALGVALAVRMAGRLTGRSAWALAAGFLLACHTGYVAWSTGGLETTLYAAAILGSAAIYLRALEAGRGFALAGAAFGVTCITRPDAFALLGLTAVHLLWQGRHGGKRALARRVLGFAAAFAVVFGPWFAWRWSYYGWPLPNTFYAKVGTGTDQYLRGLDYLGQYVVRYGAWLWLAPLLGVLVRGRDVRRDYLALLLAAHAAAVIYVGGDSLRFHRFMAYVAPIACVLAAAAFAALAQALRDSRVRHGWPAALLLLLCAGWFARTGLGVKLFPRASRFLEPQSELAFPGLGSDHAFTWFENYFVVRQELAARWLDAHTQGAALVATTPAGAIAYHSRLAMLDMLGLNDAHIAHRVVDDMGRGRAGHEKGDGAYVLARKPDYILLGNVAVLPFPIADDVTMAHKLVRRSEHELWSMPAFHRDYERVCVRLADHGLFQWFTFYQRRDRAPGSP